MKPARFIVVLLCVLLGVSAAATANTTNSSSSSTTTTRTTRRPPHPCLVAMELPAFRSWQESTTPGWFAANCRSFTSSSSSLPSPGLAILSRFSNFFGGKAATAPSPTTTLPLATATTSDMPGDGMIHQIPEKTPPPGANTTGMATEAMSSHQPRSSGSSSFSNLFRLVIARILRVAPDDLTWEVSWFPAHDEASITPTPVLVPTKTIPLPTIIDTPSDGPSGRLNTEDYQRKLEAALVLLLFVILVESMVLLFPVMTVASFINNRKPSNGPGKSVSAISLNHHVVETIPIDRGTDDDIAASGGAVSSRACTVEGSEMAPEEPTADSGSGPVRAEEPQQPPPMGPLPDPELREETLPATQPPSNAVALEEEVAQEQPTPDNAPGPILAEEPPLAPPMGLHDDPETSAVDPPATEPAQDDDDEPTELEEGQERRAGQTANQRRRRMRQYARRKRAAEAAEAAATATATSGEASSSGGASRGGLGSSKWSS